LGEEAAALLTDGRVLVSGEAPVLGGYDERIVPGAGA
jgi:hypothetical protein